MPQSQVKSKVPTLLPEHASAQGAQLATENALCTVLADTYRLMINTQGLHWNGQGRAFFGLHKLSEEQYRELFEAIDVIAERIRALSYPAPQTFQAMLDLSTLTDIDASAEMPVQLAQLADRHAELATRIAAMIVDPESMIDIGSVDLLTQRVRVHEKFSWLLRSVANS